MLNDYLASLRTDSTRSTYRTYIKIYLTETLHEHDFDHMCARYITENRDYCADLVNFARHGTDTLAPTTVLNTLNCVTKWLEYENITLSAQQRAAISRSKPDFDIITSKRALSVDDIKLILDHADVRMRAMILMLCSSGMRIGELEKLKIQDVDFSSSPTHIHIRSITKDTEGRRQRASKTGKSRDTFISDEATTALRQWLAVKDSYVESGMQRNAGLIACGKSVPKVVDPNILFPFGRKTISKAFSVALKKAGLWNPDEFTNVNGITLHSFRSFFRSQMGLAVPGDVCEILIGHSNRLNRAYVRLPLDQLRDKYIEGMDMVTVSVSSQQYRKDVKEVAKQTEQTARAVDNVLITNKSLEQQIADLRAENARLAAESARLTAVEESLKNVVEIVKQYKEKDVTVHWGGI